jgi:pimeloyl-ACP methyl ester carboxylesterase
MPGISILQSSLRGHALWIVILLVGAGPAIGLDQVEHHFAENSGVRIHYAALGEGDLIVFIHGFPDFWYSWRHQMEGLQGDFRVVALDTRGYNQSDQPEKQEDYDIRLLVQDVAAVIEAEQKEKAVVVGHDWGGAIAWHFAVAYPHLTERLIIVNLPHPKGMLRELATNPEQQANSQYARAFQLPESHKLLSAEVLAGIVAPGDEETRTRYLEAFGRSSFKGMMNYYRQNYPRPPYESNKIEIQNVSVPVLQFHGLKDTALHHHGLNNTWEWIDSSYTLVTIPKVGHWAHHEAAELVTNTIRWWLKTDQ